MPLRGQLTLQEEDAAEEKQVDFQADRTLEETQNMPSSGKQKRWLDDQTSPGSPDLPPWEGQAGSLSSPGSEWCCVGAVSSPSPFRRNLGVGQPWSQHWPKASHTRSCLSAQRNTEHPFLRLPDVNHIRHGTAWGRSGATPI